MSNKFIIPTIILFLIFVIVVIRFLPSAHDISQSTPTETSQITVQEDELIATFPEIPVYPNSEIQSSYHKSADQTQGFEAVWNSEDSVVSIAEWYLGNLPNDGWRIVDQPRNLNSSEIFIVAEKDSLIANLSIEKEDGYTEIVVEFPVRSE